INFCGWVMAAVGFGGCRGVRELNDLCRWSGTKCEPPALAAIGAFIGLAMNAVGGEEAAHGGGEFILFHPDCTGLGLLREKRGGVILPSGVGDVAPVPRKPLEQRQEYIVRLSLTCREVE